jgi:hypothetical protein
VGSSEFELESGEYRAEREPEKALSDSRNDFSACDSISLVDLFFFL